MQGMAARVAIVAADWTRLDIFFLRLIHQSGVSPRVPGCVWTCLNQVTIGSLAGCWYMDVSFLFGVFPTPNSKQGMDARVAIVAADCTRLVGLVSEYGSRHVWTFFWVVSDPGILYMCCGSSLLIFLLRISPDFIWTVFGIVAFALRACCNFDLRIFDFTASIFFSGAPGILDGSQSYSLFWSLEFCCFGYMHGPSGRCVHY